MSLLQGPTKSFFFYSILYQSENWDESRVLSLLSLEKAITLNPSFNPLREYYTKEMGDQLERLIVCDEKLISREDFIPKKVWATAIEEEHKREGRRSINIDVGILSLENILLATGKPYSHRVYLGRGVYAEPTYYFQEGKFQVFPWTYPDYQHEEKLDFFQKVREKLKKVLHNGTSC